MNQFRLNELFLPAGLLALNLMQATHADLTGDEALYWMYAQNPDWGYRDHPPMIGWLIKAGTSLLSGEVGVRLLPALMQSVSVWLIYQIIKPVEQWKYALLVLSVPVLAVYGFIATPDSPLLFFTVVYLYLWKKFIGQPAAGIALLLGICMAALMWSKYHGFLVIVLCLIPQRTLWFNRYFWLAAGTGVLLFFPHIWWQIAHDLPTLKFHLVDRNVGFQWHFVTDYLGGQLLVLGLPLLWLVVLRFRQKASDSFEQSLRWMVVGFVAFFFLSSLRSRVEPHWTAVAVLPALMLAARSWAKISSARLLRIIPAVCATFALLILATRAWLMADDLPFGKKEFHINRQRMEYLHTKAGEFPVCFMNSYQNPSLYMFYTGGVAHSLNNANGGRNQYDYWDYAAHCHLKNFLYVMEYPIENFEPDTLPGARVMFGQWMDNLPLYHKLCVQTDEWLLHLSPGQAVELPAVIYNRNSYSVNLKPAGHALTVWGYMNHKRKNQEHFEVMLESEKEVLEPGEEVRTTVRFTAPAVKGTHLMYIAFQLDNHPVTYQSNRLRLVIE